jgi:hypothetical protein
MTETLKTCMEVQTDGPAGPSASARQPRLTNAAKNALRALRETLASGGEAGTAIDTDSLTP